MTLWPFMRSRDLITTIKHWQSQSPKEEWTFSMQGSMGWEQMNEFSFPKCWGKTVFGYLFSSLTSNIDLTCLSLKPLHFIPSIPPVFPDDHSHCCIHFIWFSCLLNHWYGLADSFSRSFLLVSVRINFVRWVVCVCNETMFKHTRHLLLFSHSQNISSWPRRRLE